jgi:hypothetical protein
MDHSRRAMGGEKRIQGRPIADVGAAEDVARMVDQVGQRFQVAGVGQFVDIHHLPVRLVEQQAHQCRADETGAAGDE